MPKEKKKITQKVVKPGKDIVASMTESFRKKLLKHVENGIKELTIDFSAVEMVDSAGLGVLIATHNSLKNMGGRLKITNVSEDINKLFRTMRLDKHFEVQMAG